MAHESVMGRNNYFFKTHIYLALGYHKHEYCRPADCNISDYLDGQLIKVQLITSTWLLITHLQKQQGFPSGFTHYY